MNINLKYIKISYFESKSSIFDDLNPYFLKNILSITNSFFILFSLLILLYTPIMYLISEFSSKNKYFKYKYEYKPTLLISLYIDYIGFPKLGEIKKNKKIIVGYDSQYIYTYDLNNLVNDFNITKSQFFHDINKTLYTLKDTNITYFNYDKFKNSIVSVLKDKCKEVLEVN